MADSVPRALSQIPRLPVGNDSVRLTDASELSKVIVKGASDTNLARQLGAVTSGTSAIRGQVRIGQIRPREWVYLGPADAVAVAVADLDLSGHTAVTDVSHGRAAVRVTGSEAAVLLNRCCSIDFGDSMFPDRAMAGGAVAGVRCQIMRDDVDHVRSYLVSFDRSYAQYLAGALTEIATEFE